MSARLIFRMGLIGLVALAACTAPLAQLPATPTPDNSLQLVIFYSPL